MLNEKKAKLIQKNAMFKQKQLKLSLDLEWDWSLYFELGLRTRTKTRTFTFMSVPNFCGIIRGGDNHKKSQIFPQIYTWVPWPICGGKLKKTRGLKPF